MRNYQILILVLFLKTAFFFLQGAPRTKGFTCGVPIYTTHVDPYINKRWELKTGKEDSIPSQENPVNLIECYDAGRVIASNLISGFKNTGNRNHRYEMESNRLDSNYNISNRKSVKENHGDLKLLNDKEAHKSLSECQSIYKGKKIKVTGEQVFYSLNPKTNLNVSQKDMVILDYSSLMRLNADLSGGIKGTIDKPGGRISVEVFGYNDNEVDGFQKLISMGNSGRAKLVYGAYSDVTNVNAYVEKTTNVPYAFAIDRNGNFRRLGETRSNNVKLLGANSKSGWFDADCDFTLEKALRWLEWKLERIFYNDIPDKCQDVVTKIRSGKQPVLVKVHIKDATLYDVKIPGVTTNVIEKFNTTTGDLGEYKIVKKLKVTFLESSHEFRKVTFYEELVEKAIAEVNRYYTAKTGRVKNPEITAEIGAPRILFKDIDLIVKKGSRENYNLESASEFDKLLKETGVLDNNDKTIPLLFVHTISASGSGSSPVNLIRGCTYSHGRRINNEHFCLFSYDNILNTNPNEVGSMGSTIAHELGHYFGLKHTFLGGCSQANGGDTISDTPPAEGTYWYVTNSNHSINKPCENAPRSCSGIRRQIENLMDYGPCRWLFTKEQTKKMMDKINTKLSLFNILTVYEASVDPDRINIVVNDERPDQNPERGTKNGEFSIRMLYSNAQIEDYSLEVITDKPERATVHIFDVFGNRVYEVQISVKKGLNLVSIPFRCCNGSGVYLLTYSSDEGRVEKLKFVHAQ